MKSEEIDWCTIQDGEFVKIETVESNTKDFSVDKVLKDIEFRMKSVPFRNANAKIDRNQLCPCGSQVKFKKCCLLLKRL